MVTFKRFVLQREEMHEQFLDFIQAGGAAMITELTEENSEDSSASQSMSSDKLESLDQGLNETSQMREHLVTPVPISSSMQHDSIIEVRDDQNLVKNVFETQPDKTNIPKRKKRSL